MERLIAARHWALLTIAALIFAGANPVSSLAQGGSDVALTVAKEHLALLASHQAFLEKMYFTAMTLTSVAVALFVGLVVFFGVRTKGQIDEMVRAHFSKGIRVRVENQFDDLKEEMVANFKDSLRDAAAQVSDDLEGSNEAITKIEQRVDRLQTAIADMQKVLKIQEQDRIECYGRTDESADPDRLAWDRMRYALVNHKFVWRSLERLALAARISPEQAEAILERHPDEVRLSTGKSGRRIARHLTREPKT